MSVTTLSSYNLGFYEPPSYITVKMQKDKIMSFLRNLWI